MLSSELKSGGNTSVVGVGEGLGEDLRLTLARGNCHFKTQEPIKELRLIYKRHTIESSICIPNTKRILMFTNKTKTCPQKRV